MELWKLIVLAIVWWISGFSFGRMRKPTLRDPDVVKDIAKRNVVMYMMCHEMYNDLPIIETFKNKSWYPMIKKYAVIGRRAWRSELFIEAYRKAVEDAEKDM